MWSITRKPANQGQVVVLFALGLVALLLVASLAFDVGMALVERRDQQNAADAAALAGARYVLTSAHYDGSCTGAGGNEAAAAACRLAVTNGFVDADPNQSVTVHIPPIHGNPIWHQDGFIEVEIRATRPSLFAGVIGKDSWEVGTYAVATNHRDLRFPFSMLALDPTACKAIQVTGSGVVEAYGSIQSNSSGADCTGDPVGFSRTGGSTINVYADDATCRAVGDIQDQGSGSMTCTAAENSFALPDPLRNLPAPAEPSLPTHPMVFAGTLTPPPAVPKNCPGGTPAPSRTSPVICKLAPTGAYSGLSWILYPGLYPGGLEITAGTTAYLMPGVYWIGGGGLRVATGGSIMTIAHEADAPPIAATAIWGGGVLIYNSQLLNAGGGVIAAGGPVVLDGSAATMKLKPLAAPSSSPTAIYNDMVIFQDRALATSVTLNGSSSTTEVGGLIYVPGGQVKLNGNAGTLIVDQIIANTYLIDGGGGNITIRRSTGVDAIIVAAGLVE